MKIRKLIATMLAVATLATASIGVSLNVNATPLIGLSDEYKASAKSSDKASRYYSNLKAAVKKNETISNKMERVANIALSQVRVLGSYYPGYANYSTLVSGMHNWTGLELLNNSYLTGNTEYTRWMFSSIVKNNPSIGYPEIDCDWCAIFVSWCMYHADVYAKYSNGRPNYTYSYSLTAEPRIRLGAKTVAEKMDAFNFNQKKVTYATTVREKLIRQSDTYKYTYVNSKGKNVYNIADPINIKYKRGGIIFFYDYNSGFFSHVGIVLSWCKTSGCLTYISGNDGGRVRVRSIRIGRLTDNERFIDTTRTIGAYAEY